MKKKLFTVKEMVLIAMMAAVSYAIAAAFPRIYVMGFLRYEPKDVIIAIAGFLLGPLASFFASLLVSLLEMVTISDTGPIGCLMNLLSTCAFACTAALIYKKRRSMSGALLGLVAGSVAVIGAMLLWNWLVTPLYMGVERSYVEGILLSVFLPFNALKAGLNSGLVMILYKPLVTALRKTGLIESRQGKATHSKVGLYILGIFVLAACVLLWLVFQNRI